jgi:small subunit ribosomal protein S2
MGGQPDIIFVIDTNKESIAVAEANKLGIPVVGVIDSNSDPVGIDYPIPGNDDSIRAINFYCDLIAGSVLSGIQTEMSISGTDIGAMEEAPVENLLAEEAVPEAASTAEAATVTKSPVAKATAVEALAEGAPAEVATAPEAPVVADQLAEEKQPTASSK